MGKQANFCKMLLLKQANASTFGVSIQWCVTVVKQREFWKHLPVALLFLGRDGHNTGMVGN